MTWGGSCFQANCHPTTHQPYGTHSGDHGEGDSCWDCHEDESYGCTPVCHPHVYDLIPPVTGSNAVASYTGTATITLSPTDPGGYGVKRTYYQVDGGDLQVGTSIVIGPPESGTKSHTIEYWSVDNGFNTEAHKLRDFTVTRPESTPPVTTSNAVSSYTGTATITLSATDSGGSGVRETYYILDGGPLRTGTTVLVAPPSYGIASHNLEFWSVDHANNTETPHNTASFDVAAPPDTTAPTTGSDAVSYYIGTATITLTAADNPGGWGVEHTYYILDGAGPVEGTVVTVPPPGSGSASHTLQYYSVDRAGNIEAATPVPAFNFTVEVPPPDTTPPTTTSSFNPAARANYSSARAVTLTALDNTGGSGVANTYYRIDSGSYTSGTSFTVTGDGLHTFSYYSVDNADNTETAHTSNQFRIDTVAPSTTCDALPGGTYTGDQTFTLTPTDASGSGVASTAWRLDGGSWNSGTTVPVAAPGFGWVSHTIYWYSVDNATNTELQKSVTFTVEADGGGGSGTTSLVTSDYAWLDANEGASGAWGTYAIYADGNLIGTKPANGTSTWNCPQTAVSGGARIDVVMNVGFTNYSFIWDQNVPATFTTYLPANSVGLLAATWTGFPDIVVTTDWWDDYDDFYTGVYIPPTTIGNITFATSGGDATPPTGSVSINAGATYTNTTAASLTLSANDTGGSGLYQMRFSNDNVTWSSWESYATSKSWTLTSGNGTKTVYVQYRDNALNVSSTYSDTIVLDATAPSTTCNAVSGQTYTGNQTFTLTPSDTGGSGLAGTWYKLDSGSWTAGTSVSVTAPGSGSASHTIYWYSRDNATNQETQKSVTFTVQAGGGGAATLAFIWHPEDYGEADLRVVNSSGVTLFSTSLSGYGTDLDWYVDVPVGQTYYLWCDYYWDEYWGDEGGGYYVTRDVTTPGATYTWNY